MSSIMIPKPPLIFSSTQLVGHILMMSKNLNVKSFRKQGKILRSDFLVLSQPYSPSHTFIEFIVENYYNLCEKLVFIADQNQWLP